MRITVKSWVAYRVRDGAICTDLLGLEYTCRPESPYRAELCETEVEARKLAREWEQMFGEAYAVGTLETTFTAQE